MLTINEIKAHADTCQIHTEGTDWQGVRGYLFFIGSTLCMCLLDSADEYRWYVNRIPGSENSIRVMLAAQALAH